METILILSLSIITIIIIRKFLEMFPGSYFSIQDIVSTNSDDLNIVGFLIRFGVLFICSFIVAIIFRGSFVKVIEYSVTVSFLLIWPFILQIIIYRNKHRKKNWGYVEHNRNYITKYLIVYFLYSFMCVWVSIGAVPIYNLFKGDPSAIYAIILGKYMTYDPLIQGIFGNIIADVVWFIVVFFVAKIYKKYIK
jgi:hypothetical protein